MQLINWNEDYLINNLPFQEYDWLELKGRKEIDISLSDVPNIKRESLGKAISALANSGGGYLVLGIDDKTKNIDSGGIPINLKHGTKEWLENILPPLVEPRLPKFNVIEITTKRDDLQIFKDHAIYIVEIEDSELAPHQSSMDHVYYFRSASRSMPANHQIVMDIIGRQKHPLVNPTFSFAFVNSNDPNKRLRSGEHKQLVVILTNEGNVLAEYVNIILYIPKYLLRKDYTDSEHCMIIEIENIEHYRLIRENVIPETFNAQGILLERGPGRYTPILPKRTHSFLIPIESKGDVDLDKSYSLNSKIIWEVYADNMPVKKGSVEINSIHIDHDLPWS